MDDTRHRLSRQKGFTLIEVMIALVILVVGVLGVLSMQRTATISNAGSMALSRGVHEVTACLDRVSGLGFDAPELAAGEGKSVEDLFGPALVNDSLSGSFTTAISYDVIDIDAAELGALLHLVEGFTDVMGKRVVVSSTQQIAGRAKIVRLEYLKIDLGEGI